MKEQELTYTYTPADLLGKEVPYPYGGFCKVTVYTHRVYGCCPINVEGDKLVFDGMWYLDESEVSSYLPLYFEGKKQLCPLALQSIFRYAIPMTYGISAIDLGIAKSGGDGYVKCLAACPPTGEGVVIYRLHAEPIEKGWIDRYYEYEAKAGHIHVPDFYFEKFASTETKERRKREIAEWRKAGSPVFWEGFRNPPCQPQPRGK